MEHFAEDQSAAAAAGAQEHDHALPDVGDQTPGDGLLGIGHTDGHDQIHVGQGVAQIRGDLPNRRGAHAFQVDGAVLPDGFHAPGGPGLHIQGDLKAAQGQIRGRRKSAVAAAHDTNSLYFFRHNEAPVSFYQFGPLRPIFHTLVMGPSSTERPMVEQRTCLPRSGTGMSLWETDARKAQLQGWLPLHFPRKLSDNFYKIVLQL